MVREESIYLTHSELTSGTELALPRSRSSGNYMRPAESRIRVPKLGLSEFGVPRPLQGGDPASPQTD